jgi:hypothetical protein
MMEYTSPETFLLDALKRGLFKCRSWLTTIRATGLTATEKFSEASVPCARNLSQVFFYPPFQQGKEGNHLWPARTMLPAIFRTQSVFRLCIYRGDDYSLPFSGDNNETEKMYRALPILPCGKTGICHPQFCGCVTVSQEKYTYYFDFCQRTQKDMHFQP